MVAQGCTLLAPELEIIGRDLDVLLAQVLGKDLADLAITDQSYLPSPGIARHQFILRVVSSKSSSTAKRRGISACWNAYSMINSSGLRLASIPNGTRSGGAGAPACALPPFRKSCAPDTTSGRDLASVSVTTTRWLTGTTPRRAYHLAASAAGSRNTGFSRGSFDVSPRTASSSPSSSICRIFLSFGARSVVSAY